MKKSILGNPADEYSQALEEMRALWQIRYTQLTIFVSLNAGFLYLVFNLPSNISFVGNIFLRTTMVLLSVCFIILNNRVLEYYLSFRKRAQEIEKVLGFNLFSGLKSRGRINSHTAVHIIYLTSLLFWIVILIQAFLVI